jgi:uncharacterized protein (TIGR02569 family)
VGEVTDRPRWPVPSLLVPTPPPTHVLAAFGAGSATPERLPGGRGLAFRCADIVLKPVDNTAESSWLAATFEQLRVSGIRVARPVRSSDGRWVIGGWSAQRFVSGRVEPRYDEVIETSLLLHEALADVPSPRYLRDRDDLYTWADRLAWGEEMDARWDLGGGHGARLLDELAVGRKPVDLPPQVVHGDMFGNVLFAGSAPPAVIDITPYWHPASWAAAVIAVDALSWGGAQTELLQQWAHLPEWPQMLLRALMFRLAVSLAHPRSTPSSLVEMLSAAEIIRPFLE